MSRLDRLVEIFEGACFYCGKQEDEVRCGRSARTNSGRRFNIDHLIPRGGGGTDRWSNLVLACVPCNKSKKDTIPTVEQLEKAREIHGLYACHPKTPREYLADNTYVPIRSERIRPPSLLSLWNNDPACFQCGMPTRYHSASISRYADSPRDIARPLNVPWQGRRQRVLTCTGCAKEPLVTKKHPQFHVPWETEGSRHAWTAVYSEEV